MSGNGKVIAVGGYDGGAYTYHFDDDNDQWKVLPTPILPYQAPGDGTGAHMDLSQDGNFLAVGSSRHDGKGTDTGAIRIFKWTIAGWNLHDVIIGEKTSDGIGQALAISWDATTIVSSNILANADNIYASGVVYTWKRNINQNQDPKWIKDQIAGSTQLLHLGNKVCLSADGQTIAAEGDDNFYVFKYNQASGTWEPKGSPLESGRLPRRQDQRAQDQGVRSHGLVPNDGKLRRKRAAACAFVASDG